MTIDITMNITLLQRVNIDVSRHEKVNICDEFDQR